MAPHPRDRTPVIVAIAFFKLLKGALLILAGVVALKLIGRDISDFVLDWAGRLNFDPNGKWVTLLLSRVTDVSDRRLEEIGAL